MTTTSILNSIVQSFRAPIRYAVAYGSGVFPQKNNRGEKMLDFLFGVTYTQHWHHLNLRQNPHHYSFLRYFGSGSIQRIQEGFGGAIYYNTECKVNGHSIKYGVISLHQLCHDLSRWETLYCAGRLHKPVVTLRDDATVGLYQHENLRNAVRLALLQLPEEFTEEELFFKITNISYVGDFRMKMLLAENPRKVYNIVYQQIPMFQKLYKPIIEELPDVNYIRDGVIQQNGSGQAATLHLKRLPESFRMRLISAAVSRRLAPYKEEDSIIFHEIANSPQRQACIEQALVATSYVPSVTQALKGIMTAGPMRSLRYAVRKMKKSYAGQRK